MRGVTRRVATVEGVGPWLTQQWRGEVRPGLGGRAGGGMGNHPARQADDQVTHPAEVTRLGRWQEAGGRSGQVRSR